MTEQALLSRQQSNTEKDALFPTSPANPELTTDDVIFPSEDRAPSAPEDEENPSYDDLVKNGLKSAERVFEASLGHKVKTELVAQFFDKQFIDDEALTTGAIDLERVSTVIQTEMEREVTNNFQNALYLENVMIPQANVRHADILATQGVAVSKKFERDIERLYARVEISTSIAEHIEIKLSEIHNSDSELKLASTYVERLKDEARKEAVSILIDQKEALARQQEAVQEREEALARQQEAIQLRINILENELPEIEPVSASIELAAPDTLIHQLTEKAKSLAHSIGNKIKTAS